MGSLLLPEYRTSRKVSEVGLARTCHKGEPTILRRRVAVAKARISGRDKTVSWGTPDHPQTSLAVSGTKTGTELP